METKQISRKEHLEWCKKRALEYLDRSPPAVENAVASMVSDLGKHDGTRDHIGIDIAIKTWMIGRSASEVRKWIEGFN